MKRSTLAFAAAAGSLLAVGAYYFILDWRALASTDSLVDQPNVRTAYYRNDGKGGVDVHLVAGGSAGSTVDPIEANGPIFEDWPPPQLALMFSGELDGYLEPCGCAGLENQLGGLKRRHTMIKQLQERGWPLVMVDAGGLVKRVGPQAEIKYRYGLESLLKMGYLAVGLGTHDLQLNTDAVVYAAANLNAQKNPLTSANVGVYDFQSGLTHNHRVTSAGGKRVGVTTVLGTQEQAKLSNSVDILLKDPKQALAETAPQLAGENCDIQLLVVHGNPEEASQLAQQFAQFDFVVATGGAEVPPSRPEQVDGSQSLLIEAGHKGMYTIVVGLYDDPNTPWRYQRVPLDTRFEESPEMQKSLVDYQQELKTLGLEGLGLKGSPHPDAEFVGSETCADCHTNAWAVFEETPHAHAFDTLKKLVPPRQFDPECLSCHVTGWNPQQYFPYATGYLGEEETPNMLQNGCENCHGPGGLHVAAEFGDDDVDDAEIERRRAAMRMKIVENEGNKDGQAYGAVVKNCMECHDLDNSPDFDFQKYWPEVKHVGVD